MIDTDSIKANNDIIDVVGGYIHLKKKGNEYSSCCPFHEEKTPSFSVSPSKQLYHCFGCGAGGDLIDFVKNIEGVDFVSAAKMLGGEEVDTPIKKPIPMPTPKPPPKDNAFARQLLTEHIQDMHYADKAPLFAYLESRGITGVDGVLSDDIGFIERCRYKQEGFFPAIFSILRNYAGKAVTGHRGWINKDRQLLPSIYDRVSNGAAIRAINNNSKTLVVAEGLETLLSVYVLNGRKPFDYWSTVSAGGMQRLIIQGEYEEILIYADLDKSGTGQRVSQILADRYPSSEVFLPATDLGNKKSFDFNDLLKM